MTGLAPGPEAEPDDPGAYAQEDWIRALDAALDAADRAGALGNVLGLHGLPVQPP